MKLVQTVSEFDEDLVSHEMICVLFSTAWCSPCKQVEPFVESLEQKYPTLHFIHVDIDHLKPLAKRYKVESIPYFVALTKDKKIQDRYVSANQEGLKNFILRNFVLQER
jgi:thioredoxin 1